MRSRTRLTIILPIILVTTSLEAQVLPSVIVDNMPSTRIAIVPIDDAHRSQIPRSLGDASGLPAGSFILINHTATPVTAVVVHWTYSDSAGNVRQGRLNCDAYVFAPLEPIIMAKDLSLITPDSCTRQELFHNLATGALLGSPLKPTVQIQPGGREPALLDPAVSVHVQVDSVFFEDGQIWGPDKFDITASAAAASPRTPRRSLRTHQEPP
jgi:hypothetical protein